MRDARQRRTQASAVNACFALTAMPPDVRRGYAPPEGYLNEMGYAPGMASGQLTSGQSPNRGHSPIHLSQRSGEAEPRLTFGGGAVAKEPH